MKYFLMVKHLKTGKIETLHCATALLRGLEAIHRSDCEILRQWDAPDEDVPTDAREVTMDDQVGRR